MYNSTRKHLYTSNLPNFTTGIIQIRGVQTISLILLYYIVMMFYF